MIFDNINFLTLAIFAPILILVGLLGFAVPASKSPTSGAPAYNIFHIVFGIIGAVITLNGHRLSIRAFNIAFGLIDLYQAAGERRGLVSERILQMDSY